MSTVNDLERAYWVTYLGKQGTLNQLRYEGYKQLSGLTSGSVSDMERAYLGSVLGLSAANLAKTDLDTLRRNHRIQVLSNEGPKDTQIDLDSKFWVSGFTTGPATLVTDTFTRADSAVTLGNAETGQAWNPVSGTWGIRSNAAYAVTPGSGVTATVNAGLNPANIVGYLEVSAILSSTNAFAGCYPMVCMGGGVGDTQTGMWRLYFDGGPGTVRLQDGSGTNSTGVIAAVNGGKLALRAGPSLGAVTTLTARYNDVDICQLLVPTRSGTYVGIGVGIGTDSNTNFESFSATST